jgi:hypothetical protein
MGRGWRPNSNARLVPGQCSLQPGRRLEFAHPLVKIFREVALKHEHL